jgi:hypothetical protein
VRGEGRGAADKSPTGATFDGAGREPAAHLNKKQLRKERRQDGAEENGVADTHLTHWAKGAHIGVKGAKQPLAEPHLHLLLENVAVLSVVGSFEFGEEELQRLAMEGQLRSLEILHVSSRNSTEYRQHQRHKEHESRKQAQREEHEAQEALKAEGAGTTGDGEKQKQKQRTNSNGRKGKVNGKASNQERNSRKPKQREPLKSKAARTLKTNSKKAPKDQLNKGGWSNSNMHAGGSGGKSKSGWAAAIQQQCMGLTIEWQ